MLASLPTYKEKRNAAVSMSFLFIFPKTLKTIWRITILQCLTGDKIYLKVPLKIEQSFPVIQIMEA